MPEGDTLFRAARTLHRALAGDLVTSFETVLPQLTRIDRDAPVAGRLIESVTSAGKHLLMRFSGDLVLHTHMRMNGSWHVYRPGERWRRPRVAMRIALATERFVAVAFNVPVASFQTERALARDASVAKLGPDLAAPAFDAEEGLRRFRARPDLTSGEALLNQRVLSGAGNVFKSEILFLSAINPWTVLRDLDDEALAAMIALARKLLRANVAETSPGAIITYTGFRRTTGRSDPAARLWVYGRGGEPCRRCGTPIERALQGIDARSTYWCPSCQPPFHRTPGT